MGGGMTSVLWVVGPQSSQWSDLLPLVSDGGCRGGCTGCLAPAASFGTGCLVRWRPPARHAGGQGRNVAMNSER